MNVKCQPFALDNGWSGAHLNLIAESFANHEVDTSHMGIAWPGTDKFSAPCASKSQRAGYGQATEIALAAHLPCHLRLQIKSCCPAVEALYSIKKSHCLRIPSQESKEFQSCSFSHLQMRSAQPAQPALCQRDGVSRDLIPDHPSHPSTSNSPIEAKFRQSLQQNQQSAFVTQSHVTSATNAGAGSFSGQAGHLRPTLPLPRASGGKCKSGVEMFGEIALPMLTISYYILP